eukprot:g2120.t1
MAGAGMDEIAAEIDALRGEVMRIIGTCREPDMLTMKQIRTRVEAIPVVKLSDGVWISPKSLNLRSAQTRVLFKDMVLDCFRACEPERVEDMRPVAEILSSQSVAEYHALMERNEDDESEGEDDEDENGTEAPSSRQSKAAKRQRAAGLAIEEAVAAGEYEDSEVLYLGCSSSHFSDVAAATTSQPKRRRTQLSQTAAQSSCDDFAGGSGGGSSSNSSSSSSAGNDGGGGDVASDGDSDVEYCGSQNPASGQAGHKYGDADSGSGSGQVIPPVQSAHAGTCTDTGIEVLSSTVTNALSDLPHARFQCALHKFGEGGTSNLLHCAQCFCFVCDTPVAECIAKGTWTQHCHASDKSDEWKRKRADMATKRRGGRRGLGQSISSISGDIFSSTSDDEDYNSDDNSCEDVSSESGSGSNEEDSSASDSDNDGVVQCRGTTLAGNRCRITSDHDFAAAEPLQAGSRYCAKHAHQEYENFSDQEDV